VREKKVRRVEDGKVGKGPVLVEGRKVVKSGVKFIGGVGKV